VHFEVLKNGRQINPASFLGSGRPAIVRSGESVVRAYGSGGGAASD
jgi:hypothetical protein